MNAISIMSALAQPTRLAVFSLLARAGENGMIAGDLAERTGTPANTMSAHLTILSQAGLATSRRAGRNIFYSALPDAVRQLTIFLIKDCCDGCATVCNDLEGDLNACRKQARARVPKPSVKVMGAASDKAETGVASAGRKPR